VKPDFHCINLSPASFFLLTAVESGSVVNDAEDKEIASLAQNLRGKLPIDGAMTNQRARVEQYGLVPVAGSRDSEVPSLSQSDRSAARQTSTDETDDRCS
jgi:hypothetical protein